MPSPTSEKELLGRPAFAPPYDVQGARTFLYVLKGDRRSIERFVVRPALGPGFSTMDAGYAGLFLVAFTDYESVESASATPRGVCRYSYRESAVYVLVEEKVTGRIFWFIPALHVNAGAPAIAGRAFYGLPLFLGRIQMHPYPVEAENALMETRAQGLVESGRGDRSESEDLIVQARYRCEGGFVERASRRDLPERRVERVKKAAAEAVGKESGQGRVEVEPLGETQRSAARSLIKDWVLRTYPLLCLKRIPSASEPDVAVYQARIEAPVSLKGLESIAALQGAEVRLANAPGVPLASACGVRPGQWVRVVGAVWAKSSFELGFGIENRTTAKKKRIAILGGGLAGVAAALYLSDPRSPKHGRHEITIYQQGWRLGGKGASGRSQHEGKSEDSGSAGRIEEHGLHIWLGFYENAFRLIRSVYEEWDIPSGHPWWAPEKRDRWRKAFKPSHQSCHVEPLRDGKWELWRLCYPRRPGDPGDAEPLHCDRLLYAASGAIEWMDYFHRLLKREECPDACLRKWLESPGNPVENSPRAIRPGRIERRAQRGRVWNRIAQALDIAVCLTWLPAAALRLLPLLGWKRRFERLEDVRKKEARKVYVFLDLAQAVMKGVAWNALEVAFKGLDALDDYDLREFLRKYGADKSSAESQIVDSLYDGLFAVPEGRLDAKKEVFLNESLAAGAAIRCFIDITLAYKEAPMWKMNGGMGDVVFAPIYQVLKDRGVQIKLFHRVESLHLSADKKRIASVDLREQAQVKAREGSEGESGEYDPLIEAPAGSFRDPLMCWPSEPRYEQLKDGEELHKALKEESALRVFESGRSGSEMRLENPFTLRSGRDFDSVVLAIPVGALGEICPELLDANARFAEMVEKVRTVRTAAYQTWLGRSLGDLGWEGPPPVLGNFIDPLNTWADMTHLASIEGYTPKGHVPAHIAYFVGAMPDGVPVKQAKGEVENYARRVLDEMAEHFWPGARAAAGGFERDGLLLAEYFRANTTPSDRYVLSVAGSTKYRLWPDESGFENLVLAGDWTRNYLNIGCVEATVISAMLASQALCGYPEPEDIAHRDRF
ncbi:MAG TPA: FAD-dependent oxidoreductase [Verrucomicrobiales bacterium]|nr:FAD-dependent oxidoreductase [Verrucomicrobiales bacterium]